MIPINIRPMRAEDDPIVYDSWFRAMARELEIETPEERSRYWKFKKPVIRELLSRGAWVAVSRADDSAVLGWICGDKLLAKSTADAPGGIVRILHFIFVKKDFRRGQIATQLIKHLWPRPETHDVRASHSTSWGFPRVARLFKSLEYKPELGEIDDARTNSRP